MNRSMCSETCCDRVLSLWFVDHPSLGDTGRKAETLRPISTIHNDIRRLTEWIGSLHSSADLDGEHAIFESTPKGHIENTNC
jgi:hypothetical protein